MGEIGWRYVSLAGAGSNPWLVLGVEQPQMPAVGWNLTVNRAPVATVEMRVNAGNFAEQLRRSACCVGLFWEISLAGVA